MSLDTALVAIVVALALAALGIAFLVVKMTPRSGGALALGAGAFEEVLAAADTGGGAGREELFAAAVAAKHLLRFDQADLLLGRIVDAEPGDGEAWLERGLVAAYRGDLAAAGAALDRAAAGRADLLESITLHRAWVALAAGDPAEARRRFEEVETPLENKLRSDLGSGEPLFAEWFLQAADLWEASGDRARAAWARREGAAAAPESPLARRLAGSVSTS